jgi:hypothetical protein
MTEVPSEVLGYYDAGWPQVFDICHREAGWPRQGAKARKAAARSACLAFACLAFARLAFAGRGRPPVTKG